MMIKNIVLGKSAMFQGFSRTVTSATMRGVLTKFVGGVKQGGPSRALHAADNASIIFPREKKGLNYNLNWSLAADDVVPEQNAFRNMTTKEFADFGERSVVDGSDFKLSQVDVSMSFDDFDRQYQHVTTHLSHTENVFVHDGALGSFKSDRTRVRVITDSPWVAEFARNMLVRVPTKDVHATREIVVYVATALGSQSSAVSGSLLAEEENDGTASAKIVISGVPSFDSLLESMSEAKKQIMQQSKSQSLLLPCDVMETKEKVALVFNASGLSRDEGVSSGVLYAAHNAVWNSFGVTSVFGGALLPSGSKSATSTLSSSICSIAAVPSNNLVEHPIAAVFVDSTSAEHKNITADEAGALVASFDASLSSKFQEMLQTNGTKAFVVATESDIAKVLQKM